MQVQNSKTARHSAKKAVKGAKDSPVVKKASKSATSASKSTTTAPVADVLTTAHLAELAGMKATKVRNILRSRENDVKPEWKAEGGRWLFKKKYKDDVVKFLSSDKRKAATAVKKRSS